MRTTPVDLMGPDLASIHPSEVLAAYLQNVLSGRRTALIGDSSTGLAERLAKLSGRSVLALDPDRRRVAANLAKNQGTPSKVRFAPLEEAGDLYRGAFDAAIVSDSAGLPPLHQLLDLLETLLSARGMAFIAAPNPDSHPDRDNLVGYYELFDRVSERFEQVQMLGQAPFTGYTVAAFASEGEPAVTIDSTLVSGSEEPSWFIIAASNHPVQLDPYTLVQIPVDDADWANESPVPEDRASLSEAQLRGSVMSAELEKMRDRLDEQARQAQDRERKATSLSARVAELQQERDALQTARDALQTERDALQTEHHALQTEHHALQSQRDAAQTERDALQNERSAIAGQASAETDELQTKVEQLQADRTSQAQQSNLLVDELRGKLRAQHTEVESQRDELAEQRNKLDSFERERTRQGDAQRQQAARLQGELETLSAQRRSESQEAKQRIAGLQEQARKLEAEGAAGAGQRRRVGELETELEALVQERESQVRRAKEQAGLLRRSKEQADQQRQQAARRDAELKQLQQAQQAQLLAQEQAQDELAESHQIDLDQMLDRIAELEEETGANAEEGGPQPQPQPQAQAQPEASSRAQQAHDFQLAELKQALKKSRAECDTIRASQRQLSELETRLASASEERKALQKQLAASGSNASSDEQLGQDVVRLETRLRERGEKVASQQRDLQESERTGRELLLQLQKHIATGNGTASAREQGLKAQLDALGEKCSRSEADLQTANWKLTNISDGAADAVSDGSDHDKLEEALRLAHAELVTLRQQLSSSASES